MFDMHGLGKQAIDGRFTCCGAPLVARVRVAMAATEQAGGRQQALGLPGHRLAGIEQHGAGRHAPGNASATQG